MNALVDPRIPELRRRLIDWGADHGRTFYWRSPDPTPYSILIAESLLAKTRAEIVEPIARELIRKYPNAEKLAIARRTELQTMLRPLGLHRKRAQQLIACARALVEKHGGAVPSKLDELVALPSIGRYAAGSIALVAFGERTPVVDANVVRVYRRVFSLPPPPERLSVAHDFWELADRLLPSANAKAFTWALLDLGGTICIARTPQCTECPLAGTCNLAVRQASSVSARSRRRGQADGTRS